MALRVRRDWVMIAEMSKYYEYSRATYYAVIAALPLLLAYELLLSLEGDISQGQVRNAADVWLRTVFISLGVSPSKATLLMILAVILAIPVVRTRAPGSGFLSITATLSPRSAAARAQTSPAKLPPTMARS